MKPALTAVLMTLAFGVTPTCLASAADTQPSSSPDSGAAATPETSDDAPAAGASSKPDASAKPAADRLVCASSRPLGSHRKVKACRTKEQADQEREAAQSGLMELRRGAVPVKN